MLDAKKKKKDSRFQCKQSQIFNNDFQYETGSQKGELLSSVFFDQIPEMEVKWQNAPTVIYMWWPGEGMWNAWYLANT